MYLSGFTSITLPTPLFHFPPEQRRQFTPKDLIDILRHTHSEEATSQAHTRAQCCADALDKIALNPERKRAIFSTWPRPSKGAVILHPNKSLPGKTAPNGNELWGETMFDFYTTSRHPDMKHLCTLTTGSKMAAFAKANGEVEVAEQEVEWAETENEPQCLDPYSLTELEVQEANIRSGMSGISCRVPDVEAGDESASNDPFHQSNLPSPWPLLPFSYQPESLQKKIPLCRLPQTITVHDPWNLLAVKAKNIHGTAKHPEIADWSSQSDRTHTYRLVLSSAGERKIAEEMMSSTAELQPFGEPIPIHTLDGASLDSADGYFLNEPNTEGALPPAVWIIPPAQPVPETPPLDSTHAHLYLSPSHRLGEGNHSVVYNVEWELPRTLLMGDSHLEPVHCRECGRADAMRILKETDGEDGEKMDPKWKEMLANCRRIISRTPEIKTELVLPSGREITMVTNPSTTEVRYEYHGAVRPIHTSVGWQDPHNPTCSHLQPIPVPPPIVRVRVVAKLSMMGDGHLAREADNYQKFKDYMFEHWTGMNLIPQCHDPVPLGPIVPQFFGYYLPDDDEKIANINQAVRETRAARRYYYPGEEDSESDSEPNLKGYFSPILLQELCGQQIDPDDLTEDESNEVASLFYRLHAAGWTHNSVYPRNVLYQYGPLDLPYHKRHTDRKRRKLSFRVIDFGRSVLEENRVHARPQEEHAVDRLFYRGLHKNGRVW